jgi:hypothetical protein
MNSQETATQLPQAFKIAPSKSVQTLEIRTEQLDPITATNNEVVFQLPMNGILDGGSFVQLAVEANSAAFLPIATGIHALIDSCELQVGTKVIMTTQKYAHRQTAIRQLDSPEHRAYVDMIKSGACGDRWAETSAGKIAYQDLVYNDALTTATVPAFLKPTADPSTTPVFSVPLSSLFPAMILRQLPLFAMKEQVYIRIRFNQQPNGTKGVICCFPDGYGGDTSAKPSLTNIKFMSDHLFYNDDTMNQMAAQIASDSGMVELYEDIILTEVQAPGVTNPGGGVVTEQRVENEIAVAGRVVRSLLIADQKTQVDQNPAVDWCGQYVSVEGRVPDQLNFRVNDSRVFDRNLVDAPQKYNELRFAMGRPLRVPSTLYSFDPDTDKSSAVRAVNQSVISAAVALEGHGNIENARSTQHYTGLDLSTTGANMLGAGTQIGVKPIQITKTYNRVTGDNQARTMRVWAQVERTMRIQNGTIEVSA